MNRLHIKNLSRVFSTVVDIYSWALPLNFDKYPGAYGWTYRIRLLCFNLHIRTFNWEERGKREEREYLDDLFSEEPIYPDLPSLPSYLPPDYLYDYESYSYEDEGGI